MSYINNMAGDSSDDDSSVLSIPAPAEDKKAAGTTIVPYSRYKELTSKHMQSECFNEMYFGQRAYGAPSERMPKGWSQLGSNRSCPICYKMRRPEDMDDDERPSTSSGIQRCAGGEEAGSSSAIVADGAGDSAAGVSNAVGVVARPSLKVGIFKNLWMRMVRFFGTRRKKQNKNNGDHCTCKQNGGPNSFRNVRNFQLRHKAFTRLKRLERKIDQNAARKTREHNNNKK